VKIARRRELPRLKNGENRIALTGKKDGSYVSLICPGQLKNDSKNLCKKEKGKGKRKLGGSIAMCMAEHPVTLREKGAKLLKKEKRPLLYLGRGKRENSCKDS